MDFNKLKNNKELLIAAIAVIAVVVLMVLPKVGAVLLGIAITLAVLNWDKIKGPVKACYAKAETVVKEYFAKKESAPPQDTEEDPNL